MSILPDRRPYSNAVLASLPVLTTYQLRVVLKTGRVKLCGQYIDPETADRWAATMRKAVDVASVTVEAVV
jgi:hypothetical protein